MQCGVHCTCSAVLGLIFHSIQILLAVLVASELGGRNGEGWDAWKAGNWPRGTSGEELETELAQGGGFSVQHQVGEFDYRKPRKQVSERALWKTSIQATTKIN